MEKNKYYELKGRLCEISEEKAEIINQISEVKKAIISLLNDDFSLKIWQINESEFIRLNLKLKELLQNETSLKKELQNG